jgi:hypothetical protein
MTLKMMRMSILTQSLSGVWVKSLLFFILFCQFLKCDASKCARYFFRLQVEVRIMLMIPLWWTPSLCIFRSLCSFGVL